MEMRKLINMIEGLDGDMDDGFYDEWVAGEGANEAFARVVQQHYSSLQDVVSREIQAALEYVNTAVLPSQTWTRDKTLKDLFIENDNIAEFTDKMRTAIVGAITEHMLTAVQVESGPHFETEMDDAEFEYQQRKNQRG